MPQKSPDLHGNAPDQCPCALVLIDMLNDLAFEGGQDLLPRALQAAEALAALKRRARAAGVPTLYVNDNFGRWRSSREALIAHCLAPDSPGKPVVERLIPDEQDYFVLKPKHSGFYATPLALLLQHLGAHTLVLGGITTESCVLFTATDAYLHDYELIVPRDGVVHLTPESGEAALTVMRHSLDAEVLPGAAIDMAALASR